jgi:hypothetical protein
MGPFKLEKDKPNPSSEITEVHWFCKNDRLVMQLQVRMEV